MPHPYHGLIFVPFIPLVGAAVIHAVIVFLIAGKRRLNPWGWAVATLIPVAGLLVALVYYVLTALSVLDRLDALEKEASAIPPTT